MAFDEESLNLARHFYDASDLPAKELAAHDVGLEESEALRRQLAAREKRRAKDIESLAEHIQESVESWFLFHESGQETDEEKAAPGGQAPVNCGCWHSSGSLCELCQAARERSEATGTKEVAHAGG